MKNILLLFAFVIAGGICAAQNKGLNTPRVMLGSVAPIAVNGKMAPVTRAELLSNSKLIWTGGSCKVVGYTFSIMPDGKDFIGPFTVTNTAEFTPQIKEILQNLGGGGGRVFIENIRVNCGGDTRTVQSIVFKYL